MPSVSVTVSLKHHNKSGITVKHLFVHVCALGSFCFLCRAECNILGLQLTLSVGERSSQVLLFSIQSKTGGVGIPDIFQSFSSEKWEFSSVTQTVWFLMFLEMLSHIPFYEYNLYCKHKTEIAIL